MVPAWQRNILAYLDVPTLGQPEAFIHVTDGFIEADVDMANPETKRFLQGWVDRYVNWAKAFVQR
jgi:chromate reductase